VGCISTVQQDVEKRILEYSLGNLEEITACALQHSNNLCTKPVPAMVEQCLCWETCMNCDRLTVGHAKVAAEFIAEVVNQLVEPISFKTWVRTLDTPYNMTIDTN
jgi:Di-sulfide bridge nucleocytoplasmic transport domain